MELKRKECQLLNKSSLFLFAAVLLLMAGGCGTDPQYFASSVKQLTKSWTVDVKSFGERIKGEKEPARLRADREELASKIHALVAESASMHVPRDKEAQELWNALRAYLLNQERMVTKLSEEAAHHGRIALYPQFLQQGDRILPTQARQGDVAHPREELACWRL